VFHVVISYHINLQVPVDSEELCLLLLSLEVNLHRIKFCWLLLLII